jgi:hypothetical protein
MRAKKYNRDKSIPQKGFVKTEDLKFMAHRTRLIYRIPSFKEGITRILIFLVELKMISLLSPKNMIPFRKTIMIRLKKAIAD